MEDQNTQTTPTETAKPLAPQGNRQQRRTLAAITRRMAKRPGRGYTKHGAAQDQIPTRKSEHLKLIKSMKQNEEIIDKVSTGMFDKYLDKDYGPTFAAKYRSKNVR